jgi:hypothetical protein
MKQDSNNNTGGLPVNKKVALDLTGIDGNAFVILGTFSWHAKRSGWTEREINLVLKEAQSKDYDHLLATISSYCDEQQPLSNQNN